MLKHIFVLPVVCAVLLVAGCGDDGAGTEAGSAPASTPASTEPPADQTPVAEPPAALPDGERTPGSAVPGVTQEAVCAAEYPAAQPKTDPAVRTEVYMSYGLTTREQQSVVRLDRLIGTGLGGDGSAANSWPQPAADVEDKNRLESTLRRMVCNGDLPLETAQTAIAEDWQAAFEEYVER